MYGKTPITALQEYCAKKGLPKPNYLDIESGDNPKTFISRVEAFDEMAEGMGRSKKEARHDAAANMLKRIKLSHPDIENIPQALHESVPISDAVCDLRDLCLQQDHPFPSFEIIQQSGPPEAPEFTAQCCVATIKRFGKASTKKAAKQKAAQKIIEIIRNIPTYEEDTRVSTLADIAEQKKEDNNKKLKTYREYIDSDVKEIPGTLLSDRHFYFNKMDPELRKVGKLVLDDDSYYCSAKDKVQSLLKALQIEYKTQFISNATSGGITFIELVCDFDCAFAGDHHTVYDDILSYFKDML